MVTGCIGLVDAIFQALRIVDIYVIKTGWLLRPSLPRILLDELAPAAEDDIIPDRRPDGLQGLLVDAVPPEVAEVHVSEKDRVFAALVVGKPGILKSNPSESLFWFG